MNITGKLTVPAHITFYSNDDGIEILRLTRDGVFVNPEIKPNDAAKTVLNAIDSQIKVLVQRAVEDERERCAKIALSGTGEPVQVATLEILRKERERIAANIMEIIK